jgi:hypothetical protein
VDAVRPAQFALFYSLEFRSSRAVLKWFKLLLGLLLLPVCAGAARAFWRLLQAAGGEESFWVLFAAGAAIWMVIFLVLPKPMWVYVVGHELTHAVWVWLFGGRVKQFKATARGGHVVVTKNNVLIALAPYFFPFYAVIVVLLFVAGHLIWDWARFQIAFHLLLGAAYSFHITLTLYILRTEQSDITQHGVLFSACVIFIGNVMVLLLGLPWLTQSAGFTEVFQWWWTDTREMWINMWRWVAGVIRP